MQRLKETIYASAIICTSDLIWASPNLWLYSSSNVWFSSMPTWSWMIWWYFFYEYRIFVNFINSYFLSKYSIFYFYWDFSVLIIFLFFWGLQGCCPCSYVSSSAMRNSDLRSSLSLKACVLNRFYVFESLILIANKGRLRHWILKRCFKIWKGGENR